MIKQLRILPIHAFALAFSVLTTPVNAEDVTDLFIGSLSVQEAAGENQYNIGVAVVNLWWEGWTSGIDYYIKVEVDEGSPGSESIHSGTVIMQTPIEDADCKDDCVQDCPTTVFTGVCIPRSGDNGCLCSYSNTFWFGSFTIETTTNITATVDWTDIVDEEDENNNVWEDIFTP